MMVRCQVQENKTERLWVVEDPPYSYLPTPQQYMTNFKIED